jgi:hypothetical protein
MRRPNTNRISEASEKSASIQIWNKYNLIRKTYDHDYYCEHVTTVQIWLTVHSAGQENVRNAYAVRSKIAPQPPQSGECRLSA